ncbi:MAG: hypothetical protein UY72_C0006G0010 [Candidatus Uhrbacteria bacterium GW2011_GWD2_52_7]|uniref:Uncharacterized protein n=1 Tax=Candidatus Uhrbacteria bacterium GW2011_GWD2_52_7 TaxID=1618989 RepID=A0A0G2AE04_9BACT|nr:MAG: hypothetical protein UY72_C0006G0010 [Candidatus Uhrbacteria bacterium GW2011_GWD2_52_7]
MRTLLTSCAILLTLIGIANAAAGDGTAFDPMATNEWPEAAMVLSWIEDYDEGYTHTLEYGVIKDVDSNTVYFATTATKTQEDGSNATRLSIFSYNPDTRLFMRLWRNDDTAGDREWNVIGYDNGRVVCIEQAADFQAEDCDEAVVSGYEQTNGASLWSIPENNLLVNEDGTYSWRESASAYSPSATIIDEARQRESDCQGQQDTGDTGTEP